MYVWELYNNFSLSQLNANFAEVSGKYLTANKTVYVATTGSDVTGDGTSGKPYKTITKALSMIPKNLNGFDGTINIASGTYDESVVINGYVGGSIVFVLGGDISIQRLEVREAQSFCISNASMYTITTTTTTTRAMYLYRSASLVTFNTNFVLPVNNFQGVLASSHSRFNMLNGSITINNASAAIQAQASSNVSVVSLGGTGNNIGISYETDSSVSVITNTLSATTMYNVFRNGYPTSTISETPTPSNLGTVTTILAQRNGGICRFKLNALSGTWTAGTSYVICDLTATFTPSVQLDKEVILRTVGGTYYYGTLTITTSGVVSITPRSSMSALSTLIDETFII